MFDVLLSYLLRENTILESIPRRFGSCMIWAEKETKKLLAKGTTDFKVIEGFIYFRGNEDNEETNTSHTWIELSDGTILDGTLSQFERWGYKKEDINYSDYDRMKYSPQEYLDLCKKHPVVLKHGKYEVD